MKILKYSLVALASACLLFSSCTSEKEELANHHFDNKVFINVDNTIDEKIVKADTDPEYSKNISISTALKAEEKVTATFAINAEGIEYYKDSYNPEAILFPVENCSIENAQVVVEKGANLSTSATVHFSKMDSLDLNLLYVLPVSLTKVSGIEVLKSKETVYFVFKGGALINVVVNMSENRAGAQSWKTPEVFANMSEFTIEFLAHPNKFGRLISTVLGVEGHFLLRFGDSGVDDNQLQIASADPHTNSDLKVDAGKWTHFAVVFNHGNITVYKNGSQKLAVSDSRESVTFRPYGNDKGETSGRYFWIGYSYSGDRYFDGELSEIRIWNKCLTKAEINAPAHFYAADPTDPALAAYWKCDDGAGTVIKDYTPNGNDLTLDSECKWPSVSLPATK